MADPNLQAAMQQADQLPAMDNVTKGVLDSAWYISKAFLPDEKEAWKNRNWLDVTGWKEPNAIIELTPQVSTQLKTALATISPTDVIATKKATGNVFAAVEPLLNTGFYRTAPQNIQEEILKEYVRGPVKGAFSAAGATMTPDMQNKLEEAIISDVKPKGNAEWQAMYRTMMEEVKSAPDAMMLGIGSGLMNNWYMTNILMAAAKDVQNTNFTDKVNSDVAQYQQMLKFENEIRAMVRGGPLGSWFIAGEILGEEIPWQMLESMGKGIGAGGEGMLLPIRKKMAEMLTRPLGWMTYRRLGGMSLAKRAVSNVGLGALYGITQYDESWESISDMGLSAAFGSSLMLGKEIPWGLVHKFINDMPMGKEAQEVERLVRTLNETYELNPPLKTNVLDLSDRSGVLNSLVRQIQASAVGIPFSGTTRRAVRHQKAVENLAQQFSKEMTPDNLAHFLDEGIVGRENLSNYLPSNMRRLYMEAKQTRDAAFDALYRNVRELWGKKTPTGMAYGDLPIPRINRTEKIIGERFGDYTTTESLFQDLIDARSDELLGSEIKRELGVLQQSTFGKSIDVWLNRKTGDPNVFPWPEMGFADAFDAYSYLGTLQKRHQKAGRRNEARIMGEMRDALEADITDAATRYSQMEGLGDVEDVVLAARKARGYYAELKGRPVLDSDFIKKYVESSFTPDKYVSKLNTSIGFNPEIQSLDEFLAGLDPSKVSPDTLAQRLSVLTEPAELVDNNGILDLKIVKSKYLKELHAANLLNETMMNSIIYDGDISRYSPGQMAIEIKELLKNTTLKGQDDVIRNVVFNQETVKQLNGMVKILGMTQQKVQSLYSKTQGPIGRMQDYRTVNEMQQVLRVMGGTQEGAVATKVYQALGTITSLPIAGQLFGGALDSQWLKKLLTYASDLEPGEVKTFMGKQYTLEDVYTELHHQLWRGIVRAQEDFRASGGKYVPLQDPTETYARDMIQGIQTIRGGK